MLSASLLSRGLYQAKLSKMNTCTAQQTHARCYWMCQCSLWVLGSEATHESLQTCISLQARLDGMNT